MAAQIHSISCNLILLADRICPLPELGGAAHQIAGDESWTVRHFHARELSLLYKDADLLLGSNSEAYLSASTTNMSVNTNLSVSAVAMKLICIQAMLSTASSQLGGSIETCLCQHAM